LGVVKVLQASTKHQEGGKFKVNLTCHGFCLFSYFLKCFFQNFQICWIFFSVFIHNMEGVGGFHLLLFYHPSLGTEQKSTNVH
jgi:hypothetical protein